MQKVLKLLLSFALLFLYSPLLFAQTPTDYVYLSEGTIDGQNLKIEVTFHQYIGSFSTHIPYIINEQSDHPQVETLSETIPVFLYDGDTPQLSLKVIQGPYNLVAFSNLHSKQFRAEPLAGFYTMGQTGEGWGDSTLAEIHHWVTGTLSDVAIHYYEDGIDASHSLFWLNSGPILVLTPKQIDSFLKTGTLPVYNYWRNKLGEDVSEDTSFKWTGLKALLSTFEVPVKENPIAVESKSIQLNGQPLDFQAYVINHTTYFKLRDLAYILKDSTAKFSIDWDATNDSILLYPGQHYLTTGDEMDFSNMSLYAKPLNQVSTLYINNQPQQLNSYLIDDATYFSLRDLSTLLNVTVGYHPETGLITLTTH